MVEAHTNVDLPKRVNQKRNSYPMATMAVGAFYFLPNKGSKQVAPHVSARSKKLGRKFATRTCTMQEQIDGWVEVPADHPYAIRGVGVWRTA
jgi:hypothetical protein